MSDEQPAGRDPEPGAAGGVVAHPTRPGADVTEAEAELERLYSTAAGVRGHGFTPESAAAEYGRYVAFVAAFAAPGGRLLDVGCGGGWSSWLFARAGFDAAGVDLNPAAFEPPPHARLSLAYGSATELPFADGGFDAVACCQVLEHIPDPARALDEMLRVTRPGGVVCVVGPNLLSLGQAAKAVGVYAWRNRPLSRVFVRSADMPRHPFGNTLPEAVAAAARVACLGAAKSLRRSARFTRRAPDLRPPFFADNDAVYLCNPLDLTRHFRARGCEPLADVALGRRGFTRLLAGGTWVAARKPGTPQRGGVAA